MNKKKIVFLVSGGGGTLKFIFFAIEKLQLPIQIVGIIADRVTNLEKFANKNNIYYNQVAYKRSEPKELQNELNQLKPDVIITNIHKIIDSDTLNMFPSKFINLHYSLLPSFAGFIGMETVEKAKEQNVGFIGGTCHEVNEIVDAGKIIHQGCFAVDWNNDKEIIDTVFKTSCLAILGGICTKIEIKKEGTERVIINDKEIIFSPRLPVSNLDFEENFWVKLKKEHDTI
ncbi:formyltransferase family protein [Flavobacterium lacisediminis]|jgi:phosphoribosylglycinamide formyltransferase-1|uniref:phosphoribosylglycinamide formyltransferase 1 n=1 Tax=Flavobacterium lacisediminis TaxID=2989705 RepID=A0ABT3EEB6_9FLAO|nr:formyltransferase family protein [Flavobacterium lacisediminis]MCW1146906.1 formyltransferase family protein [Flavobacterium lacisediminis]